MLALDARDSHMVTADRSKLLAFYLTQGVQVVIKPCTCPRGKSLLVECHLLHDQFVRGPITADVLGI